MTNLEKDTIMGFVKVMAAGCVAVAMMGGAALAEECTDAMLEERQEALGKWMQDNPEKAPGIEGAVKKVEAKYGGEPPRDKQCQALDELMEEMKKL